jgi:superfamily II DNA or RNA helicase
MRMVGSPGLKIRLICSPALTAADEAAFRQAQDQEARAKLEQTLSDEIVEQAVRFARDSTDVQARSQLFLWLLATSRLEVRFAWPKHVPDAGDYHEKIGHFAFDDGESAAFTGSANESERGHRRNFESVDVYRTWVVAERERVDEKKAQFEEMWSGSADGLVVRKVSSETLAYVKRLAPEMWNPSWIDGGPGDDPGGTSLPGFELWSHQERAFNAFLAAKCGVLEMATGTGKTRTAIAICDRLMREEAITTVIVATDGNDLLDQWADDLLGLSNRVDNALSFFRHYRDRHERDLYLLNPEHAVLLVSRSALPGVLRYLDRQIAQRLLLVHDEVHALGSPANRRDLEGLADNVAYRLGLSATPEREYDSEGTDFILRHIGPVIERYDLADAINEGILAPMDYVPLHYEASAEDRLRLQAVYKRAAARKAEGSPMSKEEIWTELARVYKTSRAKLPLFQNYLEDHPGVLRRCIVFVETTEYGEEVLQIIHRHRHDFHTYFAGEDAEVLSEFARGGVECLITCHRLSQGIDIQDLRNVVLFSSARSKLETIQRIGRCLRKDPRDPSKRATVIDFVRTQTGGDKPSADEERAVWLTTLAAVSP